MMPELILPETPDSIWDFPLEEGNIVFIIGAYSGTSCQYFADKYNPYVYAFEPQVPFADVLKQKFKENPKVKVLDYGLGEKDFTSEMSQYGLDGASFVPAPETIFGGETGQGKVCEIGAFMSAHNIDSIDLCVMNCEGYEYRLIPWMIEKHIIEKIKYLMVQFHYRYEGAERLNEIKEKLLLTHEVRDYYVPAWIVWEAKK